MAFQAWRTWVTGETVTAAHMNQDIRDNGQALFPDEDTGNSWSPTLAATTTNPTVTTTTGVEYQMGALGFVWVRFSDFTDGGSGDYQVDLPSASVGLGVGGFGQIIGVWSAWDSSNGANSNHGWVFLQDANTVRFNKQTGTGNVTSTSPFTFAASDVLQFQAVFPLA